MSACAPDYQDNVDSVSATEEDRNVGGLPDPQSPDPGTSPQTLSLSQFCEASVQAARSCSTGTWDLEQVKSRCETSLTSVTEGFSTYDSAAAQQCLSNIIRCKALNSEACANVFTGVIEDNAPCKNSIECMSGYCLKEDARLCDGNSLCLPDKLLGDICTYSQCEPGTYCDFETDNCTLYIEEGQGCNPGRCTPDTKCTEEAEGEWRCVAPSAPVGVGQSCGELAPCANNLYCNQDSTCAAAKNVGESCIIETRTDDWFYHGCKDGALCIANPGDATGTCGYTSLNGTCAVAFIESETRSFTREACSPGQYCRGETCAPDGGAPVCERP